MAMLMFRTITDIRYMGGTMVWVTRNEDDPTYPHIDEICTLDDMEAIFKFMANTFPGGWTVEEGEVKSANSSSATTLREEVLDLLKEGYRARAIKLYKERMDCDIGTARDYVEGLMKMHGITLAAKYICPNHDKHEDCPKCDHNIPHDHRGSSCAFDGINCKPCIRVYET